MTMSRTSSSSSDGDPGSQERSESFDGGDTEHLHALIEEHLPDLRAFIRLRTGRAILAKDTVTDLVQSACREVIEDLPAATFATKGAFLHWMYKAAERKVIDRARYWQRARRDPHREEAHDSFDGISSIYTRLGSPSQIAASHDELERFEATFAQLSEDHRSVILLHRIVGLTHTEVAREMNRSEYATRSLLFRALARLSTLLETE